MRTFLIAFVPSLLACALGETPDSGADSAPGQSQGPPPVDVLLVVDTSGSMKEEASAVLLGAEGTVDALGQGDWQLGITTTSANYDAGATSGTDAGEAGTLVGAPILPGPDAADELREQLACHTVYWNDINLPSDPDYAGGSDGSCPLPEGEEVPREYLDCLCPGGWNESEGSGIEEGLEAALDAMCLGSGDVPDACFEDTSPVNEGEKGQNAAMFREGVAVRAVVISDEGDGSRRVPNGDTDPAEYLALFGELRSDFRFYALVPAYEDADGECLDGAQPWGVQRYQAAAEETGGAYAALRDLENGCERRDVAALLGLLLEAAVDPQP